MMLMLQLSARQLKIIIIPTHWRSPRGYLGFYTKVCYSRVQNKRGGENNRGVGNGSIYQLSGGWNNKGGGGAWRKENSPFLM